MLVLGIDTSGKVASVALRDDSVLLGETTFLTKLTHSQVILPLVNKLVSDCGKTIDDIDAFVCANGPGSYTGLRIGIAAVKGICFASGKKCAGVSTLEALAYNSVCSKAVICSVMKARQDIAYFGLYSSDGSRISKLSDDTVCDISYISEAVNKTEGDVILVGDYAEEIKQRLFPENERVRLAPVSLRLQKASSLCEAVFADPGKLTDADNLNASYLQITKAEKDLKK